MRVKTFVGLCLLAAAGPASAAGHDAHVGESVKVPFGRPAVHCEIASLKSSYKPGDTPELSVRLVNDTRQSIELVGSLDDSERRVRYPYTNFEIHGPPSGVVEQSFFGCGNVNELRDVDFVEVPPGGQLDPFMRIDDGAYFPPYKLQNTTLTIPGTYTVVFHYSTASDDLSEWHGDEFAEVEGYKRVAERLRLVPRVTISCSVDVHVNP